MQENDEDGPSERRSSVKLEQHIGTILQILVVGLLTWSLNTTVSLRTDVGILQSQVNTMAATINRETADDYDATDAQRDFAAFRAEFSFLEKRLVQCESRIGR